MFSGTKNNDEKGRIVEINEEIINKLVEKAQEKQKSRDDALEAKKTETLKREDNDHPEEERKKADDQKKENEDRKIQINPPVIFDQNAPGKR